MSTTLIIPNRHAAEQAAAEVASLASAIGRLLLDVAAIRSAQVSLRSSLRALARFAGTSATGDLRKQIEASCDDLDILAEDARLERDQLQARHNELEAALERYDQDCERDLLEREL